MERMGCREEHTFAPDLPLLSVQGLPSLPHVPLPTQGRVVPALANAWLSILETELSS